MNRRYTVRRALRWYCFHRRFRVAGVAVVRLRHRRPRRKVRSGLGDGVVRAVRGGPAVATLRGAQPPGPIRYGLPDDFLFYGRFHIAIHKTINGHDSSNNSDNSNNNDDRDDGNNTGRQDGIMASRVKSSFNGRTSDN